LKLLCRQTRKGLIIVQTRSDFQIIDVPSGIDTATLKTRDLTFQNPAISIDPFLIVSLFDMKGPAFPPHPHAGFSVATYIFPESDIGFWNQDTLGSHNHIAPGSFHWTIAGSGLQHEETPTRSGRHASGLQIWINHAAKDRQVAPDGLHLAAANVPTINHGGSVVRVLAGTHCEIASPLIVPSSVRLLDMTINTGGDVTELLAKSEHGFLLVRSGRLLVNGNIVKSGQAAFVNTNTINISAASDVASNATLFVGIPLREPVVSGGPFIGSNHEEIQEFQLRFRQGGMGRLTPFDQASIDKVFDAS
jgi:quercetin 2,3-dioxygenase